MLNLLIVLTLVMPLAWFVSEFQRHVSLRVFLGACSLIWVWFFSYAIGGMLATFKDNVEFGDASKRYALVVVEELDKGRVAEVTRELRSFSKTYDPTYENYPRYSEVIDELIGRLQGDGPKRSRSETTDEPDRKSANWPSYTHIEDSRRERLGEFPTAGTSDHGKTYCPPVLEADADLGRCYAWRDGAYRLLHLAVDSRHTRAVIHFLSFPRVHYR
jgi:hypothetical protein